MICLKIVFFYHLNWIDFPVLDPWIFPPALPCFPAASSTFCVRPCLRPPCSAKHYSLLSLSLLLPDPKGTSTHARDQHWPVCLPVCMCVCFCATDCYVNVAGPFLSVRSSGFYARASPVPAESDAPTVWCDSQSSERI